MKQLVLNYDNNYITCKSVKFYSLNDEDAFFEWIKRIKCIEKFEGAREYLYLDLVNRELSYDDIKDLIALLYRYKIDMHQLAKFYNESNKNAFTPWSKKIFKSNSGK
jgi:hypothetical protein